MNKLKWLGLILVFLVAAAPAVHAQPQASEDDEAVLVGRISHVEGQLLRYVPDEKDWVATVQDAPFGLDDALYSDQDGKAEFIMPNNSWARISGDTQIQLITLKPDATVIDVASGVTRFYDKSSEAVIQATTPFGYVMAQPGAVFDLYVGDQSAEVIAIKGDVDFVHNATGTKYEVLPGASSIVADEREVASGEGNVDADWDDWNANRDSLWSKRMTVRGDSVKYLPPAIHDDAYALEENGRWEEVEYEGRRQRLWRPVRVERDWAPFTAGRWTVWNEDNTWVPEEPFGYVTHHYGNWVMVGSAWFWAPPVVRVRVTPGVIGFGWYPGRVAWIGTGAQIGWIPLAPMEPYYCHRRWGPRAVVVTNVAAVRINIGSYRWYNRAVVVNHNNFYGVRNYRNVRVTNINHTTIINNFRGAPVVNNTVVNNYNTDRRRYNFSNVNVVRKPHQTVVNRIVQNERLAKQESPRMNAALIRQNAANARKAAPVQKAVVERPKITNKVVSAGEVNKPASEVQFKQREIKQRVRPAAEVRGRGPDAPTAGPRTAPGLVQPPRSGEGGPAGRRDVTKPGGQVQPARPGEQVQPGRPGSGREGVEPRGPRQPEQRIKRDEPSQQGPGQRPQLQDQRRPPAQDDRRTIKPQDQPQPQRRPDVQEQRRPQGQEQRRPEAQEQRRPQTQEQRRPQVQEQRRPQVQDDRRTIRPQDQPQPQRRPEVQEQRRPQVQEQRRPEGQEQRRPQMQEQRRPQAQEQRRPQVQEQRRPQMQEQRPGAQQPRQQQGVQQPRPQQGQHQPQHGQQQGPAGKKKVDEKP